MKNILAGCVLLMAFCGCGSGVGLSSLRTGDLLFVVNPQGNAVTAVTQGYRGWPVDHVGIVVRTDTGIAVVEAVPGGGVVRTPVSRFVNGNRAADGEAHLLAGRLRRHFCSDSLAARLRRFEGLPYDSLYMPDDAAIYCSELVQKSLTDRQGRPLLPTIPMQFRDSQGRIPDAFFRRYRACGLEVPEGLPGTNPGQLSRAAEVRIRGFLRK